MLEKIKPSLGELENMYKSYAEQKKFFRKKNANKLREFMVNTDKLKKVQKMIKAYDESTFFWAVVDKFILVWD